MTCRVEQRAERASQAPCAWEQIRPPTRRRVLRRKPRLDQALTATAPEPGLAVPARADPAASGHRAELSKPVVASTRVAALTDRRRSSAGRDRHSQETSDFETRHEETLAGNSRVQQRRQQTRCIEQVYERSKGAAAQASEKAERTPDGAAAAVDAEGRDGKTVFVFRSSPAIAQRGSS